ncbi:MAG TPA: lipocalin family protein, partial [Ignavibacteriaceae bacterium]|nr:lipocalin family protein [Ignavibacteriaceae bacterium]
MAQKENNEPVTVSYVNLEKYIGLWYEIAKIPNSFQKKCTKNTTAIYSFNEDSTIKVVNSCATQDGEISSSEGLARTVDKKTNSKLEVSFVSIFGIHLFWGDYWIIGLDEDYNYAVIGTPDRKYGWIIARSKFLDEGTIKETYEILKKNGYNPKDFVMTLQE